VRTFLFVSVAWSAVACGGDAPATNDAFPGHDASAVDGTTANGIDGRTADDADLAEANDDARPGDVGAVPVVGEAGGVPVCSQLECGDESCQPGHVCVTAPTQGAPRCVAAPAACGGLTTCDCLGSALCPQGLGFVCYDQNEPGQIAAACISGVACLSATCSRGPQGAPSCGGMCPAGSACLQILPGTMADAGPPGCQAIPAVCADNPTCDCLGPTMCLPNNFGYGCSNDNDGCSSVVQCGNN
jgi:hypothetical protein